MCGMRSPARSPESPTADRRRFSQLVTRDCGVQPGQQDDGGCKLRTGPSVVGRDHRQERQDS